MQSRPVRSLCGAISRGFAIALPLVLVLNACSDNSSTNTPALTSLNITLPTSTIVVGQDVPASARGADQFGAEIVTGQATWATTATSIAAVSSAGVVTGVAPGAAQVTVTVGAIVGRQSITVVAPVVTTLTVSAPTTSLVQGQTVTAVTAAIDQINRPVAPGVISWASSNAAVATVSAAGVITALTAGTANIAGTAGGRTGQVAITVAASPAIRINEVESNLGSPGDWIELFNPTAAAVDVSGWGLKDSDSTRTFRFPVGTTIPAGGYLVAEEAAFGFGLGAADDARLFNQFGALIDGVTWTTHAVTTYGRCPTSAGNVVTTNTSTKGAANDCRVLVRVNEVESSGGTPGDWIEFFNFGPTPVNVSGYVVKDNNDTRTATIPAGTTIAAGAFYVFDTESATGGFGLGSDDAARLFDVSGTLVDSYSWTAHAVITYGRCPDGTGAFQSTSVSTRGAANVCGALPPPPPPVPAGLPWPGSDDVQAVDGVSVFSTNGSGLVYEGSAGSTPAVLWAVRNGPGTLFRMTFSGGIWRPDPTNDWGTGKLLRYTDGTGNPDAEGVTFAAGGSAGGMYVATERNNDASSVSRLMVLRIDPTQGGATLTATNQWDLTADLPVVGANLGLEAIAWIPDSMLVANGFFDESKSRAYAPSDYPGHGTGLFFVGVEANGTVYGYALNHTTSTFTRVATFAGNLANQTGGSGIMDLAYDRESGYLWAVCDDTCNGTMAIFEIDRGATSSTRGRFMSNRRYARPSSMPNLNNEGFTFAPNSECVNNRKPVFWADDNETAGRTIRRATMPCGTFAPLVQGGVGPVRRR